MDYEGLTTEMNNLIKLMTKEGPTSENYEVYVRRLGELQEIAIAWRQQEINETNQREELNLRRRDQAISQEANTLRDKASKRETVSEYGTALLSGVFTVGAIMMTQFIEENDIIRTKGWAFISKLIPKM